MSITNIAEVSVQTAITEISYYIISKTRKNEALSQMPSFFFWGAPGIGKSAGVRQIAEIVERETGKRAVVTDIRLLLFSPVDLRGIPRAVEEKGKRLTEWVLPKIFQLDPNPGVINLIFLDELTSAPASMQAAAYQITLDRMVGEHKLPENCVVIAAGNRMTDRSAVFRMPNALANRMIHYQLRSDFDSWRGWGINHEVHPFVLSYITFHPEKLHCEEPNIEDVVFPTPRSWMFVSEILHSMPDRSPKQLHHMISGAVGVGVALEFEAYCEIYDQLPGVADIFMGKTAERPRTPDALYALLSAMTMYVKKHAETISDTSLAKGCEYARSFPADYRTLFYKNLSVIDGMTFRLMKVPAYLKWAAQNVRGGVYDPV